MSDADEQRRLAVGDEVEVLMALLDSVPGEIVRGVVVELDVTGPDTWDIEEDGPYVRVRLDGDPDDETYAYAESEVKRAE